jgi:large subunit ribosomal protein L13
MKIIDGKNAVMGRLASYAVKEALKGEEIVILNCDEVIITGNRKRIKEDFEEKHHKSSEKIVKRVIRGMLPNHRFGRGREAFKRIKCYNKVPKEFEDKKKIVGGKEKKTKFVYVRSIK